MAICFREPSVDELLEDNLTQGLMKADRVDAAALKVVLYGMASSIEKRSDEERRMLAASSQHRASGDNCSARPNVSVA
jgi:hypothetical protein